MAYLQEKLSRNRVLVWRAGSKREEGVQLLPKEVRGWISRAEAADIAAAENSEHDARVRAEALAGRKALAAAKVAFYGVQMELAL